MAGSEVEAKRLVTRGPKTKPDPALRAGWLYIARYSVKRELRGGGVVPDYGSVAVWGRRRVLWVPRCVGWWGKQPSVEVIVRESTFHGKLA